MVFKLPSARCLSKASRDGALSENMANADINASLKGISTSSTRSSAMVAKCSRSKRKSASAQRYLRPFGTTMDIATLNLTSSTCDIVPMRAVLWHACLRKARGDTGMVTGIYRPPGIADRRARGGHLRLPTGYHALGPVRLGRQRAYRFLPHLALAQDFGFVVTWHREVLLAGKRQGVGREVVAFHRRDEIELLAIVLLPSRVQ